MRAAVYYNNSDVRVEERPVPRIGADEILGKDRVSVSGCLENEGCFMVPASECRDES